MLRFSVAGGRRGWAGWQVKMVVLQTTFDVALTAAQDCG